MKPWTVCSPWDFLFPTYVPALPSADLQPAEAQGRLYSPSHAGRARVLSKVHMLLGPPPSHRKVTASLLLPRDPTNSTFMLAAFEEKKSLNTTVTNNSVDPQKLLMLQ